MRINIYIQEIELYVERVEKDALVEFQVVC